MDLIVHVDYKNEALETVASETFPLEQYVDLLQLDLKRVIPDVESLIYHVTGLPRDQWSAETWGIFSRIRHKLLDKAGEIGRLPENLRPEQEQTTAM